MITAGTATSVLQSKGRSRPPGPCKHNRPGLCWIPRRSVTRCLTATRHCPRALQNTFLNRIFSTFQPAELETSTGIRWRKHSRAGLPGSQVRSLAPAARENIFLRFKPRLLPRDNQLEASLLGASALDTSGSHLLALPPKLCCRCFCKRSLLLQPRVSRAVGEVTHSKSSRGEDVSSKISTSTALKT